MFKSFNICIPNIFLPSSKEILHLRVRGLGRVLFLFFKTVYENNF